MPVARFRPAAELLETRTTPATLQSPGFAAGTAANGDVSDELLAVSNDGRYMLFVSTATNLVQGQSDTTGTPDLFWRDTAAGVTKLVSHKAGGPATAIGFGTSAASSEAVPTTRRAALSADGQTVAFVSANTAPLHVRNGTTEIGTADDADSNDVFVWRAGNDQLTLASLLITIPTAIPGSRAVRGAFDPVLSDDGRFLAYASRVDAGLIDPSEPADTETSLDLFRIDLSTLETRLATDVPGVDAAVGAFADVARPVGRYLSGDGQVLAFASAASADSLSGFADRGNTLDVFARDLRVNSPAGLTLVSRSRSGDALGNVPVLAAFDPVLSRDGSTVVFASNAPGGTAAASLVGAYVDGGNSADLYAVRNPFAATPSVFLVSAVDGSAGQGANGEVTRPAGDELATYAPTADGTFVVFESAATNLVPGLTDDNAGTDVFVRELAALRTEAISVGVEGATGSAPSAGASISDDGRFVAFVSDSTDLDFSATDKNTGPDVFVRDRSFSLTDAVSVTAVGGAATGDAASPSVRLAAGGTALAFVSRAGDLSDPGTPAGQANLFAATVPPPARLPTTAGFVLVSGATADGADAFGFDSAGQLAVIGGTNTPFTGVSAGPPRGTTADVNGDGATDFVFVVGAGGGSLVRVIDGANRTDLAPLTQTYEDSFTGGLFVAAGDIDGDGVDEIVVAPDVGGGARVQVFRVGADGLETLANFFAFPDDPNFRGGARVAVADVDSDGKAEVVVAAGFGGGPRVAVFDGAILFDTANPARLVNDFFAFPGTDAQTLRNGVFVAAGDLNTDGRADLVFGGGPGGGPRVFALDGRRLTAGNMNAVYANPVANFFAFDSDSRGGVRPAVTDIDGDAALDLVIGSGEGEPAELLTYLGADLVPTGAPAVNQSVAVSDEVLADGVFVG